MISNEIKPVGIPAAAWIKPELAPGFPCISSRLMLSELVGNVLPWHWQSALELFYVEQGSVDLVTVSGSYSFAAGSGALVNADVLHMFRSSAEGEDAVLKLHVFDPVIISGIPGGQIEQLYVAPLVERPGLEFIPMYKGRKGTEELLSHLSASFGLKEDEAGYEMLLREGLCRLWLELSLLVQRELGDDTPLVRDNKSERDSRQLKLILSFVHKHYGEKISVDQLAAAGGISKRACFRLFQERMQMSPIDYVIGYRIQAACEKLVETRLSVTEIATVCGLGSSSYFVKTFRRMTGITPLQYRKKCGQKRK